ncbi:BACON domain-containing protein, partial [Flavilitoribacter nigricans]
NQSISISANTDWSASDDRSWIKLSATSGSGNKTITVTCDPNLDTQARSGKMTVSGGGISLTITVTQSAQTTTSPWTITETGENHTIVIRKDFMATIDGMPISSGDLVGFFYERDGTLFCSNYFIWTGKATSVAVYGNEAETSLKEGFDTGERFRIRIYRAATEEVFEANPQFAPQGTDGIVTHRDTYAKDGLSMLLNVSAKSIAMQEIDLQTGWNMISSYIVPQDRNMLQVLAPIADRTALIKNGKGQSTLPTLGINSIGDWQIVEGYKIKATQNTTLRLEGQRIEAADTPIPLQEGWQIIAFLKDSPASIESQLNSIRDIIEVVKDNKGNTFLPEYDINNIGEMEPGQGYQIRVSQSGVLVYDSDSQPKHGPDFPYAVLTPTTHFQLGDQFNTGNNATVIFPVNTLEKHLSIGDEIGVFTAGGVLCGAGVVADDNLAITVWGDDASTEIIEGMQPGEAYAFRSWHADSEEENQLGASFASGDGIYQEDDVEIVAALDILNGLFGRTTEVSALKVYPNPATASVWVKLPEGVKTLSLYNSLGQLIKQEPVEWCKADYPVDVSRMPAGTYQLRLQAGKRIWTARVIVE